MSLTQIDQPITSSDWRPEITLDVGAAPHTISIGDVDNDGYNDIVTADFWSDRYISIILWNNTSNEWDPAFSKEVGPHPESATIGDVNNDGFNDIIATNLNNDELVILPWNETIKNWNPSITFTISGWIPKANIGDVNNDGYNDIAVVNRDTDSIVVLLWNNSIKYWEAPFNLGVGDYPEDLAIGDANNDGKNDLISASDVDDSISILLWDDSAEYWKSEITKHIYNNPEDISIEDANNDGFNDIITTSDQTLRGRIAIFIWDQGIKNWDPPIYRWVGENPSDVFVGDANNDGFNDIITANYNDDNISIHTWNETISDWNQEITRNVGEQPIDLCIGDVNNNGKNDIVIANRNERTISILISYLEPPYLEEIRPNPNKNGDVKLKWNNITGALQYFVYSKNISITSLESLVPIGIVNENHFEDKISKEGLYYYVVVAGDAVENSTISNCQSVKVILINSIGYPMIEGYILFILFSVSCIGIIIRRKLKS